MSEPDKINNQLMKKLLIKWIVLVISIIAAAHLTSMLIPGGMTVDTTFPKGIMSLFLGSAVLALLNATLGKILRVITLPLNCLTLGLFSLIINAAMFMAAGSLGFGFKIEGFWAALVGSLIVSVVSSLLGAVFIKDEEKEED